MKTLHRYFALLLVLGAAACYHATIETGLQPSGQTVKKEWAHSFIAGLVPPSTVETIAKCPNGVAKVETKLSFLNQVANIATLGIYTPMTIEVQCAAPRQGSDDAELASGNGDLAALIAQAAELAHERGAAVYIRTR